MPVLMKTLLRLTLIAAFLAVPLAVVSSPAEETRNLLGQSPEEALAKSAGCLDCHRGIEKMHTSPAVKLGCTDCHGGDATAQLPAGAREGSGEYDEAKTRAHVAPRFPERWAGENGRRSAANPERTYTLLNRESPEFVRFINPGDLRVAQESCGACHQEQVNATLRSPMTTSSIFWAAAAYANGILPTKKAILGEAHTRDGEPGRWVEGSELSSYDRERRGALETLFPLPRWQIVQPGEYFRAFERGGILLPSFFPEIGNPSPLDEPGRPDIRVSNRGRGTGLRVSPAVINLHKTRLNDPHLSFLGTNDHPGDYRSSGCSACHVVYANDRDPLHSGSWAKYGHGGESASGDATIPRGESGHPIEHRFTQAIPTSQCMSCHMHQPNAFVNTYLGYTMWDYETDGEHLWPEEQRYPTAEERREVLDRNPEGAAPRGLWSDGDFLAGVSELNPELEHTQFADYHGHGWVFRAVFKRDREGHLLDAEDEIVSFDDPEKFQKAVHLRDVHLERGMHCVDCHFTQDAHGTGLLHGEYGDAIEIECQDCHGDVDRVSDLKTSGPAAEPGGRDLRLGMTSFGRARFYWRGDRLYQRSMLDRELTWPVPQVKHTVTPGDEEYNEKACYAKTLRRDGGWGRGEGDLAHSSEELTCYTCHSAWITSCFGCHLPQEANAKSESHHYEGGEFRNYATYNPQVIRTDVFMLGKNGVTKGRKVAPVRSSSALVLSSTNLNRQRIYVQQPPISAPGFSSQAFNPHVPHTVRLRETKACEDCHLSKNGDNNAWMAQLLTLGTGFVNFIGRYAWVGLGDHGFEAVAVTEWEEPQAVFGSFLHRLAYPDDYRRHQERSAELEIAHHHHSKGELRDLQLRGEYLYTAQGRGGLEVYDVANVDNKDFSERIVSAPVSPLGQRTFVRTRDATAVALPTNMPMAPQRTPLPENLEQEIHPIYRYALVADREEGLVLVDVTTLTNGDPMDNFLERTAFYDGSEAFNPGGALDGAEAVRFAGHLALVGCDAGLVVVDFDRPTAPKILATLGELDRPHSIDVQFRYAFVAERAGLAVVEITDPASPRVVARLGGFDEVGRLYVARTYLYLAVGAQGLAIVDVTRPEVPRLDRLWDAEGELDDVRDVKVGSSGSSLFAYLANGEHGLAVVQLTSPEATPGYLGFSPRPEPKLIAKHHTHGEAVALSRGLDRDRAVDETGHQVSVFNRIGARPLTLEEMRRLYVKDGEIYRVTNETPDRPSEAGADQEGTR